MYVQSCIHTLVRWLECCLISSLVSMNVLFVFIAMKTSGLYKCFYVLCVCLYTCKYVRTLLYTHTHTHMYFQGCYVDFSSPLFFLCFPTVCLSTHLDMYVYLSKHTHRCFPGHYVGLIYMRIHLTSNIDVRGGYDKFPDFFRMGTFIDSTHNSDCNSFWCRRS